MGTITINTAEGSSKIYTGTDWKRVSDFLPSTDGIIITDTNVRDVYGKDFPGFPVIAIEPGESSKSLETIGSIVEQMLQAGIDREGFILGIGGGVVCDIAGFTASVYMRGIRFGFVSTTLLSQVDASTGGKNGVNSRDAKNIIGVFNNPEFVICDQTMLLTLPEDEYRSGLAEMIKTAIIGDAMMTEQIASLNDAINSRDTAVLEELVNRAVRIKASIVEADMRESGLRRLLNFGHTFGHAAEMEYGIHHGCAVAWGMVQSMKLSVERGYLSESENERLLMLFERTGILPPLKIDNEIIAGRLMYDKKRSGTEINFVFLERAGKAFSLKTGIDELAGFLMKKGI